VSSPNHGLRRCKATGSDRHLESARRDPYRLIAGLLDRYEAFRARHIGIASDVSVFMTCSYWMVPPAGCQLRLRVARVTRCAPLSGLRVSRRGGPGSHIVDTLRFLAAQGFTDNLEELC